MKRHKEFGDVFLSWRLKRGDARVIVGVLKETSTGVLFQYTEEGKDKAKKHLFTPYAGFPNVDTIYTQNVLDIFGQRLMRAERPDIQKYYDLWGIPTEKADDKLYLLAKTQGIQAGDMFEFLADYNPIKGLSFMSEICDLSHRELPSDALKTGDRLTWKKVVNNADKYAIMLYKEGKEIGYVKRIHNRVFHKAKRDINISVASIETNGHLNRAGIQITIQ